MESIKMALTNLLATAMHTQTQRTDLWTQGGEGEGEMYGESNMEIYTLPYVKQIASGNFLYDAGNSNLVLYDYFLYLDLAFQVKLSILLHT